MRNKTKNQHQTKEKKKCVNFIVISSMLFWGVADIYSYRLSIVFNDNQRIRLPFFLSFSPEHNTTSYHNPHTYTDHQIITE